MNLESKQNFQSSESPWSFQAGNLALDYANTVDWHASDNPEELLNSYVDLLKWAEDHSLLTADEFQSLISKAKRHPKAANDTLDKAITLRESIYRIFSAAANGNQPGVKDLTKLKEVWGQAVRKAQIVPKDKEFTWNWENQKPSLEMMLWPVSQAAVDLLLSKSLKQVGQCADDRGCGQLFIDTSRNHSRQWCNMDTCGNRAKAQRHYRRSKKGS